MTTLLFILLGVNLVALIATGVLFRKMLHARRTRRVEAPNSQYASRYVRDLEARERWESLDLACLHALNREEVERTLAKARATSVRALTDAERAFLDRMVEAQRRVREREAPAPARPSGVGPGEAPRPAPGTP